MDSEKNQQVFENIGSTIVFKRGKGEKAVEEEPLNPILATPQKRGKPRAKEQITFDMHINKDNCATFIAKDKDNNVLGEATIFYQNKGTKENPNYRIWVDGLYTSKHQKEYTGVGTALMQVIMEYGNQLGCKQIALDSAWSSQRFYLNEIGMDSPAPKITDPTNPHYKRSQGFAQEQADKLQKMLKSSHDPFIRNVPQETLEITKQELVVKYYEELVKGEKSVDDIQKDLETAFQTAISSLKERFKGRLDENTLTTELKTLFDKLKSEVLSKDDLKKTLESSQNNLKQLKEKYSWTTTFKEQDESYRTEDHGSFILELPKAKRAEWDQRIKNNPILKKTNLKALTPTIANF